MWQSCGDSTGSRYDCLVVVDGVLDSMGPVCCRILAVDVDQGVGGNEWLSWGYCVEWCPWCGRQKSGRVQL